MMSSKQVFYTISSIILVVVVVFIPSYHLRHKKKMKKCSINYFNKHQEFVTKINNRIKCRKYTGASELVDIAYIDNYEYIDDT